MKKTSIVLLFVLVFTLAFSVAPAAACGDVCDGPGVGTPGYWKNHPEAWPVQSITIGEDTYSQAEILEWMNSPVKHDKTITMFKAYVAAYLNVQAGNCSSCLEMTDFDGAWADNWLDEAYGWLDNYEVGSHVTADTYAWQHSHGELIYWWLDAYNNGLLCAPPRD